jgi:hypothetical protein
VNQEVSRARKSGDLVISKVVLRKYEAKNEAWPASSDSQTMLRKRD